MWTSCWHGKEHPLLYSNKTLIPLVDVVRSFYLMILSNHCIFHRIRLSFWFQKTRRCKEMQQVCCKACVFSSSLQPTIFHAFRCKCKNILLSFVCFTDLGRASSFYELITHTWKSTLSRAFFEKQAKYYRDKSVGFVAATCVGDYCNTHCFVSLFLFPSSILI